MVYGSVRVVEPLGFSSVIMVAALSRGVLIEETSKVTSLCKFLPSFLAISGSDLQ